MSDRYWCLKCKKVVVPLIVKFNHPDLGTREGYGCPTCGQLVTIKDDGLEPKAGEKLA
ncbi:hypothetical protein LCGC14_1910520 [marine sediment metagenome]|uniref:Uncharacterized protein n=1 Tax=marine sediment metagenome TaxID=412755 RepID=A0A0F9I7R7_9ZZZZ